jgi:DNA-binding NtrC family response regulator
MGSQDAHILLVEDEPTLRRVFARALKAAGFDVDRAVDGMAGLERVGAEQYDALVSDVCMPRMSGLELLQHTRRTQPELPVVLLTAQLDAKAYGQARDMGSVRYLLKPVGLEQLVHAVESAVELGRSWKRSRARRTAHRC